MLMLRVHIRPCKLRLMGCRHLPKNFYNVHNLKFRKDAEGNPTKLAIGLYSGEQTLCLSTFQGKSDRLPYSTAPHS